MLDTTKVAHATVHTASNVWSFLANMGFLQIVVIFILIVVLLTLFILFTKPVFKIGGNYISFGSKADKRKNGAVPHSTCPYNIDFYHVITKTSEITTKKCYMDYIVTIDKQMTYVEEKMVSVKSMLLNNYADMLKKKVQGVAITASDDYVMYHRLVESMLRENVKSFVKRSFVENGFTNLSDTEFKVYINEKFDYLYQIASEFMDVEYISSKMLISREELKQSVLQLKPSFLEMCYDVYSRAIRILEEIEEEKKSLQLELDNFCERIVGLKKI